MISLGGHAYEVVIKTVHKTLLGSLFVRLKLDIVQFSSNQIASPFTGEVVYYLFGIPLLAFLV